MTNQVLVIFFFMVIYLISLLVEYWLGIRYKKSSIYKGEVQDSIKTEIVRIKGRRFAGEIYETYDVLYEYKGELLRGEVRTREKGLKHGDKIDVHVYENGGFPEIQSDIYWRRSEFAGPAVCVTVIVVFMLGLYLFCAGLNRSSQQHSYMRSVGYNEEPSLDKYVDVYYNTYGK